MKKQIYIWSFLISLLFFISGCKSDYSQGMDFFEQEEYEKAIDYFNKVDENNEHFVQSQKMITKIDSIFEQQRIEQERKDSIARVRGYQKRCYRELIALQESAIEKADERYPDYANDWEKHTEYVDELDSINLQKLLYNYVISEDSLNKILVKAVEEKWDLQ